MIVLYVLLAPIALFLIYLLFLYICELPVDKEKLYTEDSKFYRAILNCSAAVMTKLFRIRIHTDGKEKLPEGKRILFVCNHISCYDPILTWLVFKDFNISFISKPSNFNVPFFGKIIRRCCFLPIDRENAKNAVRTINAAAELIKSAEVSVGVYPEGTRSRGGKLLPFHDGVFRVAKKAECDIAVLSIMGTENIYRNVPFKGTDVWLDVAGVITAEEAMTEKSDIIGEKAYKMIEEMLRRRTEEVFLDEAHKQIC